MTTAKATPAKAAPKPAPKDLGHDGWNPTPINGEVTALEQFGADVFTRNSGLDTSLPEPEPEYVATQQPWDWDELDNRQEALDAQTKILTTLHVLDPKERAAQLFAEAIPDLLPTRPEEAPDERGDLQREE